MIFETHHSETVQYAGTHINKNGVIVAIAMMSAAQHLVE